MFNWKSFLIVTMAGSTLFAQFKFTDAVKGNVVLKDSTGKALEIKDENASKLKVELLVPSSLDKIVLKNQFQVRILLEQQEAIYDVVQIPNPNPKANGRIDFVGPKEENKQDFAIQCYLERVPKNATAVKYAKANIACVKPGACKSYALNSDKTFKLSDSNICLGKKEVERSVEEVEIEESLRCVLLEDFKKKIEESINVARFAMTRTTEKELFVNKSVSECK